MDTRPQRGWRQSVFRAGLRLFTASGRRRLGVLGGLALLGMAQAAATTVTYDAPPGTSDWQVPAGVQSLDLVVTGSGGGGGNSNVGGAGGTVSVTGLSVMPGDTLTLSVGAGGEVYSLASGALVGAGGSASAVSLNTSILVIAGGGGGGGGSSLANAGNGGAGNAGSSAGAGKTGHDDTGSGAKGGGGGSTGAGGTGGADGNLTGGSSYVGPDGGSSDSGVSAGGVPNAAGGGGGSGYGGGGVGGSATMVTASGTLMIFTYYGAGGGAGGSIGPSGAIYSTASNGGAANGGAGGNGSIVIRYSVTAGTITTLGSSANPSALGQAVTLTATVTPATGSAAPTGTVSFSDGATLLCTNVTVVAAGASGSAQCNPGNLAVGAHNLQASYSGDADFGGSSGTLTQTVTPVRTLSGPAPGGAGTITVTLSGPSGPSDCSFASYAFQALPAGTSSPPPGHTLPYGAFQFSTNNACAGSPPFALTLDYPQPLPDNAQYYKFGPTADDASNHWYPMPGISISGSTISFAISDGGLGDDDLTANGFIVDGGGVALPANEGGNVGGVTPIPTLREWGLLLLAGLLGLSGLIGLRALPR